MSFNSQNIQNAKAGFEYKCLFVLIEGYRLMKKDNKYSKDWEEEQFSAQLTSYIELCPSRQTWRIHIKPEIRIYTQQILSGKKLPRKASRIDMQMLSWQNINEEVYHIEAKNLCENNWIKCTGAKVSSSYQLNRYVNYGICHFISGYYPSNGCMCGYILEGNEDNIIHKLNTILTKKSLNNLELIKAINGHNSIYKINFRDNELINLFFNF